MPHLWIDHSIWILNGKLRLISKDRGSKAAGQEQSIDINNTVDDIMLRLQDGLSKAPQGSLRMDGLSVHVGAPWIKYDIIPWQEGLNRNEDWPEYAKIIMSRHFGTDAQGWHVSVAPADYGSPRVAASIDEVLYQTMVSFAKSQRLKIKQFDTVLFSTANTFSAQFKAKEFALVVLEPAYAAYAFNREGTWQGVGSLSAMYEHPNGTQLAAMLRDAAMLCSDFLPSQVYLSSFDYLPVDLQSMAGFTPHWLGLGYPTANVAGQASS